MRGGESLLAGASHTSAGTGNISPLYREGALRQGKTRGPRGGRVRKTSRFLSQERPVTIAGASGGLQKTGMRASAAKVRGVS